MNENVNNTTNLAKDNRLGIFMFFIDNINAKTKRSKDYKEKRIHYGINVFKLREIIKYSDVKVQGQDSINSLSMGMFMLRNDVIPIINLPKWLGKSISKEKLICAKIAITDFNNNK